MASPGRRRNSNNQLLQELEALSQSLYKSQEQQPARRGGSLSTLPTPSSRQHAGSRFTDDYLAENKIPLPGLVHARQAAAFVSPRNIRHSIANPHVSEEVSSSAGPKARFSTSATSLSGFDNNASENVDIRGRRTRSSFSPFRWRKHEENHKDHERNLSGDHANGKEVDFNRRIEEPAEKSKFWTWKPLRALSHIGLHRFNCVFSVYVNAIEDLSASMNGLRLAVYLRKKETKEGAVHTIPSRVFEGTVEFDETLHIRCHVYGGRHGSQGLKFQSRPFTISVVAVDAEELDMGKHQLDLSMLLQDTEQIQAAGEECNGWDATFDLRGKARGAKLAVGLGYELFDKDGHGNNITSTMSARYKDPGASRDRKIFKSLSNSTRASPKTVPAGFNSPYRNTKSSPFMVMDHLNLDEEVDDDDVPSGMVHSSLTQDHEIRARQSFRHRDAGSGDFDTHHGLVFAPQQNGISEEFGSDFDGTKEKENQEEEADFEVVEIQDSVKEEEEAPTTAMDSGKSDNKKEEEEGGEIVKEVVQEKQQMKKLIELDTIVEQINALESVILEKSSTELLAVEQLVDLRNEADDQDVKVKRDENINVLMDDEVELVEGEFLHMLEEEDGKEEERSEISKAREGVNSNEEYVDDDMELASILEAAENELQKATQSLDSKRRAALLEDEEAEALMQEWGLNEKVFQNFPPNKFDHSGVSGRQVRLPDLGEGLGSLVRTRDGGMLASMNPGHFRSSERLVMHLSKPIVVPAEMGDNAVEVLQKMAGMGTVCMAEQALACMPLDDITGKTVEQIAFEGMASAITKHGQSHTEQKGAGSRKPRLSGLQSLENMNEEYVSPECIAPLAIRRIEGMVLEGLKIQAEMAEEEAPYSLPPVPLPKNGNLAQLIAETDDAAYSSNGLMSMVISLDEWTKLDAGIPQDGEETKGRKEKAILAAHRAKLQDEKKKENGFMGNSLTIALLVQLRDPLRNNEAVGSPMIAFVQAERVKDPSYSKISRTAYMNPQSEDDKEEEDSNRFKIKGVHLSGLKLLVDEKKSSVWGTEKQHMTGSRWLLANGMAKNPKHHLLKSKVNQQQTQPQTRAKHGESIWSISAPYLDTVSQKAKRPVRNPDVVFPKRNIIWRG